MRTLMDLQESNGIWDPCEDEPYRTYHATMCGAQALLAHRFRGFGPGIPSVVPLLFEWVEKDEKLIEEYRSDTAKQRTENALKNGTSSSEPQNFDECTTLLELDNVTETALAELKQFMKNAAKFLVKHAPSPRSPSPTVTDINVDDGTRDTLQKLAILLSSYVRGDAVDINALRSAIAAATGLSITADIVVSFGTLPKDLKMASKGKGKAMNSEINTEAAALMQVWKTQISAKHEESTGAVISSNDANKEETAAKEEVENNDVASMEIVENL